MADAHKNFAYSTVATAPSPATSGTSLVVAAAGGALFPAVPFNAVIWPVGVQPLASNAEVVRVTGISTDTLTITRTQESSSARTVVVGDQIMAAVTNKTLTDAEKPSVLSYVEFASPVTISATTEAASDTIVTAASVTVDGSTLLCVEFFAPSVANATGSVIATLWRDTTDLGVISYVSTVVQVPFIGMRYLTPSAGSYAFSIRGYRGVANGTISAGTGGVAAFLPGYIRVSVGG